MGREKDGMKQSAQADEQLLAAFVRGETSALAELAQRYEHLLLGAVADLPEDKRTVVLLCYHQGMTHEQVAEILDVPLGTIKSRLHSALQQLRARLSPEVKS